MSVHKIDPEVMMRMYREGRTKTEIAKHFGVHWVSVHERMKSVERQLAAVPDVTKSELSRYNIDTVQQLRNMNDGIMSELDRCRVLIDKAYGNAMERQSLEKRIKQNPTDEKLVEKLKNLGLNNITELLKIQTNLVAVSAEGRKQIELQVKIYETVFNTQLVAEFQEEILAVLREVDPDVRNQVIKKLKERRSMRGLMKLT